jgi:methylenetetrahydrofolate reductase (NADPH)
VNAVIDAGAHAGASLKQRLRDFVAAGSTEVTPHDEAKLAEFAREIPAGYRVYVAHTPKASLDEVVRIALRLKSLGLTPVPHIVARRIVSADALRRALDTLVARDIRQILLIAGDRAEPEGPFSDTLQILDSRVTVEAGIAKLGVAGHPEGHPSVGEERLWQSLIRKQAFGQATGTQLHIATQFGFDARSLSNWGQGLAARAIAVPVHAGVAGPTPFTRLLKYAVHCGVGASLKAVSGNPLSFSRLPHLVTRADEMLLGVFRAKQADPVSRIFAPHFFAFGGVLETARWLQAVIDGSFELDSAARGFSINT